MPSPTLQAALEHAIEHRWKHCRDGGANLISQAKATVATMVRVRAVKFIPPIGWTPAVTDITQANVQDATREWYAQGLSPATITKRLNCLRVLGVDVAGVKVKHKVALKWWLTPEAEAKAIAYLTVYGSDEEKVMADLIQWTTKTGLRIEESLRLTWADASPATKTVMVPGLKTATSQATLPLGEAALDVLSARFTADLTAASGSEPVFPITYDRLKARWSALREAMQWTGNGVTLKALRRSAARYLHVDCGMPIDVVRHYLRHEDVETTMGYLRLTGGYGTEEMRRYLK